MKRLICILLLFCAVFVHAEMKLNRSTRKYYSVPMTPEIDQDEYDRLYKKYLQQAKENLNLRSFEYTKLSNELAMLVIMGIKTKDQQDKYDELYKRGLQMAEEGFKAGEPYWVRTVKATEFIEKIDIPTSNRLLEDMNKLEPKDAVRLTLAKRKAWGDWLLWLICSFMLVLALSFARWLGKSVKSVLRKLFKNRS